MATRTLSVFPDSTESCDNRECSLEEHRTEVLEAPGISNRAARGAVTGVLLGAGLWTAILVLVGVIKI